MKKIGELPDEGVVAGVVAFSLAPPTAMTKLSALIVAAHSWLRAERLKQGVKVNRDKGRLPNQVAPRMVHTCLECA